jgi:hypothetical protein
LRAWFSSRDIPARCRARAPPPRVDTWGTQAAIATLGGAVVAARQLPADTGAALLDTARDAFVRGLVLCQFISGIGTLALAVFAWATFRRVALPASSSQDTLLITG